MVLNLRFLEDLNYFCLEAVLTVYVHVTCVSGSSVSSQGSFVAFCEVLFCLSRSKCSSV